MIQLHILYSCFLFALCACVGSFLNVVIWRLPHRGREVIYLEKHGKLTLSWPPSHCPVCDSPIHWYQNIPVFSWLFLRGQCANCRTHIPIRYPLVELGTALLFLAFYLAYFVAQWPTFIDAAGIHPSFTDIRIPSQAMAFALHLLLISALLAASAIDADWFIIPLSIPYMLVIVGLIAVPFIEHPVIPMLDVAGNWNLAKPTLGAAFGVLLANLLLYLKILPQSFADLPKETLAVAPEKPETAAGSAKKKSGDEEEAIAPPPKLTRTVPSTIAVFTLLFVSLGAWYFVSPKTAALVVVAAAILIFLIGVLPRDDGQADVTDEVLAEISVPQARFEILKEFLFLLVPVACGVIAYFLPWQLPSPAWFARLIGALLGLLAGGGVVWIIRIGGTLAFGKEAMGLGDVHLMAGIGVILGAPLVLIAFLLAPFPGILWAIVLKILGKPNVLPYGPWLSIASILCLLVGKPLLGWYLTFLMPMGAPPPVPPIPGAVPPAMIQSYASPSAQ